MDSFVTKLWKKIAAARKRQLMLLFTMMLLTSCLEVAGIGAVLPFLAVITSPNTVFEHSLAQPIITALNLATPRDLLPPLTILFIVVTILAGSARVSLLWIQTRLGHGIGADISARIYELTLCQPYRIHLMRNSSEIISGVSVKVNDLVNLGILPCLTMMSNGVVLIAILIFLFFIHPGVAFLLFLGFGSLYITISILTKNRIRRNGKNISKNSNLVIKCLQEGLGGIRDIIINGTQGIYLRIYKSADQNLRYARAQNQIISAVPRFVIDGLGMSLLAGLAYYFANQDAEFSSTVAILGAFAFGAQRTLPLMQQIYHGFASFRSGKASIGDVLDLLEQPLRRSFTDIVVPILFKDSIRLREVSFSYPGQKSPSLTNVDLEIKKGTRVGITGESGSGKSTLLDILMGLMQPTHGFMEIDSILINEENCSCWMANVAHVPQSIFLSDNSIAENIAFGIPIESIDMHKVIFAAEQAQIAATIESFEYGYKTLVGERGIRLSGGQRQRIGIARALYKQAMVIVLDEATSALDRRTESSLIESLNAISTDITIITVAHRLTTLKGCDVIYNVSQGRVFEV